MDKKIVITIARGYGSGGRTIGKMLSKELNIPFYDREILYMASDDSGINLGLFQKHDEEISKGLFDSSTHKYSGSLIPPEDSKFTSKENLFNYQAKIIKSLAEKESCIIVGRCADYILKDFPNCCNVFIYADLPYRIERIQKLYNMNADKAQSTIAKTDKKRASFYNYYTGKKWTSVENYDLCINSANLGVDGSVEMILSYLNKAKNN